ncbi:hypothetical protein Nmel_016141, partial [Mimus melanotis]|jgi:hypothetical protein
MGLA